MAKRDIGRLLATGSPKQRLLILAEHEVKERYGKKGILTASEVNQISNSFIRPNEIKLWNKWLKVDRIITTAIINLQSLKYETLMQSSNLRGYIILWETLQEAEVLSNHILHEIKDQEQRIKTGSLASKAGTFLFTNIQVDKEGYLKLDIDFDSNTLKKDKKPSLYNVINNVKRDLINSALRFLSYSQAVLDYMDEEGFNVKAHKDEINSMIEQVNKPLIGWDKYESQKSNIIDVAYKKRLYKLMSKYVIAPNTKILEIDPEFYNYFKNNILRDE